MISLESIEELAGRIVRKYHPEKVVLFGSYAARNASDYSDVDLLVVMSFEGPALRQSLEMVRALKPRFAVDIVVRRPEEISQRLGWGDFFLEEALGKGRVLYESRNA